MKSSKDLFKTNLDKAFSTISLDASTMKDHMKYKQGFNEQNLEGGLADGKTLMDLAQKHSTSKGNTQEMYKKLKLELDKGIRVEMEHTKSRVKAKEIAMDHLFEDPEYYNKLRKSENKEAEGYSDFYPGGKTPGLTTDVLNTILTNIGKKGVEDKDEKPKNKYRNPKKKETKEATGSGSSGAYSGPVFGGDDAFWERSRSETPKLKESDVEKVEAKRRQHLVLLVDMKHRQCGPSQLRRKIGDQVEKPNIREVHLFRLRKSVLSSLTVIKEILML